MPSSGKRSRNPGVVSELPCPKAFEISEKYGIPKMEIARVLQQAQGQDQEVPAGLLRMSLFLRVVTLEEAIGVIRDIAPAPMGEEIPLFRGSPSCPCPGCEGRREHTGLRPYDRGRLCSPCRGYGRCRGSNPCRSQAGRGGVDGGGTGTPPGPGEAILSPHRRHAPRRCGRCRDDRVHRTDRGRDPGEEARGPGRECHFSRGGFRKGGTHPPQGQVPFPAGCRDPRRRRVRQGRCIPGNRS